MWTSPLIIFTALPTSLMRPASRSQVTSISPPRALTCLALNDVVLTSFPNPALAAVPSQNGASEQWSEPVCSWVSWLLERGRRGTYDGVFEDPDGGSKATGVDVVGRGGGSDLGEGGDGVRGVSDLQASSH